MASDFDTRWDAWQRRSRTRDRIVARRFVIAIPVMAVAAALVFAFYFR